MDAPLLSQLLELGIDESYLKNYKLSEQKECGRLVEAEPDIFGRVQLMSPETLSCWRKLKGAAKKDSIELHLVSAFRSVKYQHELIMNKLKNGEELSAILEVNAIPGFSEHHTGRALDLSTSESPPLSEEFELTKAFEWLQENAANYQFSMSFPRSDDRGIIYEPWHWLCQISS